MPTKNTIGVETMIILVVLFAVIGFLVPTIFGIQNEPSTVITEQDSGETITLTTGLQTTVNDINDTSNYANITIRDIDNGAIHTVDNLTVSESATQQLSGGNVTITYLQQSNTDSTFEYEYPTYYGWPEGTPFLLQISVSFIVWTFILVLYYIIQGVE